MVLGIPKKHPLKKIIVSCDISKIGMRIYNTIDINKMKIILVIIYKKKVKNKNNFLTKSYNFFAFTVLNKYGKI
jgi:hypothetical protein